MPFKRTASATPPPATSKRKNISSDKEDFDPSDYDDTLEQEEHSRKKRFRRQQEEQQEHNVRAAEDSDHDASGETKVDKHGNLKGDRQYRVPTFALPKRGGMLFMFSKDPAALLGFRDSFVFLKKNKKLQKVHISNEEKGYLVDENLLRSTFRTREISVVTARSVFKHFGHRIVKKGKKGRDDYYFTEEEYEESEEEEPENHHHDDLSIATTAVPITTAAKNRNMNTNLIPSNFQYNTNINELNWIHCAAVSARQFSTSLFMHRRNNPINYDLLTNVYQVQQNMQTQDND